MRIKKIQHTIKKIFFYKKIYKFLQKIAKYLIKNYKFFIKSLIIFIIITMIPAMWFKSFAKNINYQSLREVREISAIIRENLKLILQLKKEKILGKTLSCFILSAENHEMIDRPNVLFLNERKSFKYHEDQIIYPYCGQDVQISYAERGGLNIIKTPLKSTTLIYGKYDSEPFPYANTCIQGNPVGKGGLYLLKVPILKKGFYTGKEKSYFYEVVIDKIGKSETIVKPPRFFITKEIKNRYINRALCHTKAYLDIKMYNTANEVISSFKIEIYLGKGEFSKELELPILQANEGDMITMMLTKQYIDILKKNNQIDSIVKKRINQENFLIMEITIDKIEL